MAGAPWARMIPLAMRRASRIAGGRQAAGVTRGLVGGCAHLPLLIGACPPVPPEATRCAASVSTGAATLSADSSPVQRFRRTTRGARRQVPEAGDCAIVRLDFRQHCLVS